MKNMRNKKLPLLQSQQKNICFELHEKNNINCQKRSCSNWFQHEDGKNCVIITSKSGPKTLQEVGKIYGLTRMRICQIEKNIYEKIKNTLLGG